MEGDNLDSKNQVEDVENLSKRVSGFSIDDQNSKYSPVIFLLFPLFAMRLFLFGELGISSIIGFCSVCGCFEYVVFCGI